MVRITAHDVRHLRICKGCNHLVNKRQSVPINGDPWHGKCVLDIFGADMLVALPAEATKNVSLADVGTVVMRRLLEKEFQHTIQTPTEMSAQSS